MSKLTLSVNDKIILLAKQKAAENNTSVSAMFSQYVASLNNPDRRLRLTPLAKEASGMVEFDSTKTDKELLADALMEKYSL